MANDIDIVVEGDKVRLTMTRTNGRGVKSETKTYTLRKSQFDDALKDVRYSLSTIDFKGILKAQQDAIDSITKTMEVIAKNAKQAHGRGHLYAERFGRVSQILREGGGVDEVDRIIHPEKYENE